LRQLVIANEPNYQLSAVLRPFNQKPILAVLNLNCFRPPATRSPASLSTWLR
jgi:hypothetical protein